MKHKTKLVDQTYKRSICDEPKCKEFGKSAVQGHCWGTLDKATESTLNRVEKLAEIALLETKQILKGRSNKEKISYLYSHMVTTWMNHELLIDALVHMRLKLHKAGIKEFE